MLSKATAACRLVKFVISSVGRRCKKSSTSSAFIWHRSYTETTLQLVTSVSFDVTINKSNYRQYRKLTGHFWCQVLTKTTYISFNPMPMINDVIMAALWNRAGHYIFMLWFLSLWPPYVIRGPLYFCPVVSFFLLPSFFSSPNLSGRRLDVCHTSTHGVALVRI